MSQQNQITEVHWQCVWCDHKPCCAYSWVHATAKGLPNLWGNNSVWGYPHVPVLPGHQHLFQFHQNSIESQLCSSPYHFTYSPPSLLAPPSPEIFYLLWSCPGYSQQRGKARWELFCQPWDSFLSPYLNVILVWKNWHFFHMFFQIVFSAHIFQGSFLFWFDLGLLFFS